MDDIKNISDSKIFYYFTFFQTEIINRIKNNINDNLQNYHILDIDKQFFNKKIYNITIDNMNSHCLSFEDLLSIVTDFSKKVCLTCGNNKYYFEYSIDNHKKDGYKDNCRECYEKSIRLNCLYNMKCSTFDCNEKGYIKYDKYCKYCFIKIFPGDQRSNNYRTKENEVCNYLKIYFKDIIKSLNKSIENGLYKYRPDILIELKTHAIIIEIDENQHRSSDYTMDNIRINQIFNDLNKTKCIFIRFNPDKYSLKNGSIFESCFKKNKFGIYEISDNIQWNYRLDKLKSTINYYIDNIPNENILNVYLFYDDI